jgi:hypothetical protein
MGSCQGSQVEISPANVRYIYAMFYKGNCLREKLGYFSPFDVAIHKAMVHRAARETRFIERLKLDLAELRQPLIDSLNGSLDETVPDFERQYTRDNALRERFICKKATMILAYLLREKGYDAARYQAEWLVDHRFSYHSRDHMVILVKVPGTGKRLLIDPSFYQFLKGNISCGSKESLKEDILMVRENELKDIAARFAAMTDQSLRPGWSASVWRQYYANIWDPAHYKPLMDIKNPELEYCIAVLKGYGNPRDFEVPPSTEQAINVLRQHGLA